MYPAEKSPEDLRKRKQRPDQQDICDDVEDGVIRNHGGEGRARRGGCCAQVEKRRGGSTTPSPRGATCPAPPSPPRQQRPSQPSPSYCSRTSPASFPVPHSVSPSSRSLSLPCSAPPSPLIMPGRHSSFGNAALSTGCVSAPRLQGRQQSRPYPPSLPK